MKKDLAIIFLNKTHWQTFKKGFYYNNHALFKKTLLVITY